MKIAYVITRADAVGGASVHVREMARAMLDRGHDAVVLVGGRGPVTDQFEAAGIPFVSLAWMRRTVLPASDVLALRELTDALRRLRPDLVSAHTAKAGWIGRAACARLRIPCIYTPHGWPVAGRFTGARGAIFAVAERIAARWARAIVCVCRYERDLALAHRIAPAERLRVIHNGVGDLAPELRADPGSNPVRIVCVARMERPKDHATLLRALGSLRSLEWTLDLVGNGPLEPQLRALATSLGIAGRIRFLGYQPDPAEALARAQVFALSSLSEALPRSVLEALRAGLPVVATGVGGVAEAVTHGENGLLVPPSDPGALAAALGEMIGDASRRRQYGAAARRAYESSFRLERMIEETLAVYHIVIGACQLGK